MFSSRSSPALRLPDFILVTDRSRENLSTLTLVLPAKIKHTQQGLVADPPFVGTANHRRACHTGYPSPGFQKVRFLASSAELKKSGTQPAPPIWAERLFSPPIGGGLDKGWVKSARLPPATIGQVASLDLDPENPEEPLLSPLSCWLPLASLSLSRDRHVCFDQFWEKFPGHSAPPR